MSFREETRKLGIYQHVSMKFINQSIQQCLKVSSSKTQNRLDSIQHWGNYVIQINPQPLRLNNITHGISWKKNTEIQQFGSISWSENISRFIFDYITHEPKKKDNKKPQSYNRFEKHQQGHSLYSHFVWGNELTHLVKISPCSGVSLPLVSKTSTPQYWKNQAPKTHHGWENSDGISVEEFTCPFRQVQISNQYKHFNNIQYIGSTMYHLRFILLASLTKSSCNLFILL